MAASARPTLGRRLIWRLVLAQAGIQALVVALLFASGQLVDFRSQENTIDVLREAVTRDADGALVLRDTAGLRDLRASVPDLWFVIRDHQGHELAEGMVPAPFRALGGALDGVGQARLGWNIGDPPGPEARLRRVATEAGTVRILTGPASPITGRNLAIAVALVLWKVVLPIAVMTLLATLLATRLVVRRTLAGLEDAAREAARIDVDRRTTRLPVGDVPQEAAALVEAINQALDRLDEGYARQQRFLADAAHELRTPVAILTTRLETLPPGPQRARLLEDASRLSLLAGQLLDIQRIEQEAPPLLPMDLVDMARTVVADMAPLAIAAGYQISFDTQAERVLIAGDRPALERALGNLVQNAIQHGGRRGAIRVEVARDGTVDVSDEGPGIPQARREDVFKPFYRLHPQGKGSGLGLNLVRQIMRRHGGAIVVQDVPGGGTRLRMTFPTL